jgi:hypothetical protein
VHSTPDSEEPLDAAALDAIRGGGSDRRCARPRRAGSGGGVEAVGAGRWCRGRGAGGSEEGGGVELVVQGMRSGQRAPAGGAGPQKREPIRRRRERAPRSRLCERECNDVGGGVRGKWVQWAY